MSAPVTAASTVAVSIASLVAEMARESREARKVANAARPVGTEALNLGVSDYRKAPDPRIDASDWAVWKVRWDGREWKNVKRLAAHKTLSEAFDSIKTWGAELGLERVQ